MLCNGVCSVYKRYEWMEEELTDLSEQCLERCLLDVEPTADEQGTWIQMSGKRLLNLSSNNYLGLSGDSRIAEAANQAGNIWGAGATASRFVVGNHGLYRELEERLSQWKQREAALVFPNGYMANIGAITALAGRGDAVFSDRLNHASIVDGIVLSRADHYRYRHNDMEHLEHLLKQHADYRRKLIVTDSIFSMDGDAARLHQLVELRNRYGALLMVDEAHGSGVYGSFGEGLCHSLGLHADVDVIMGTFSKAFGVYGAYVTGDSLLIRYLLNKSRSLIYTTGLPPAVIAAIHQALSIVINERWRRDSLTEHSRWFRQQLKQAGFTVYPGDSAIVPLLVGENEKAVEFSQKLKEAGISAVAIRPPTVPAGTSRLRFSIMATHTREELSWAVEQIVRVGQELRVIGA